MKTMTLRTKLFAAFAGLAAIALVVIAVSLVTTLRWQSANAEVDTHFRRSLLLQSVRANTFQALKEVDDALTGDHIDARGDFERALEPATRDFQSWAELAHTEAERAEVAQVRTAHAELVASGRRVFALAGADREAAIRLADDEVDTKDFAAFRVITERAVNADRAIRRGIAAETDRVRNTAQVMLAISAISALSLMLLIAAYLSHDLFRPLRGLADTLERMRMGDWRARADDGRGDEIGDVARAINRVGEAGAARGISVDESGGSNGGVSEAAALAQSLSARLKRLRGQSDAADWAAAEAEAAALARSAALRAPIDLAVEPVDPARIAQAALDRRRDLLARRGIATELHAKPIMGTVLGDRAKLVEAIGEALARALDALPETGGRIGIRSFADGGQAMIEIADDGAAANPARIDAGLGGAEPPGLGVARDIVERHGGALRVFGEPGRGNVAQFALPIRDWN